MRFAEYKKLDLVATGNEIREKWEKENTFRKVLKMSEGAPKFIFFEGPPSANGMPGIHHVMARSIKDAVCRYKTQTGDHVERKAGGGREERTVRGKRPRVDTRADADKIEGIEELYLGLERV